MYSKYYLYRISTKKSDVWSKAKPKCVYIAAESKEFALKWAEANLTEGLSVSKISCLGEQVAREVYVAI